MILPTTLFFVALGYLFYTSKKELVISDDTPIRNPKDDDDMYRDIEDLFI